MTQDHPPPSGPWRGAPPNRLVVATRNPGKLREIKARLPGMELLTLADFPAAPEVEETAETYAGNARLKALSALRATGLAALGDDTGLEVDALDGLPGIDSAHFAGPSRDTAANCAKLLAALSEVSDERRTARFRCVLALAEPVGDSDDPDVHYFEGVVEGTIARAPRGTEGFGYDPLFVLAETGRTMAELTADEKDTLGHRGRALAALRASLAARRPG